LNAQLLGALKRSAERLTVTPRKALHGLERFQLQLQDLLGFRCALVPRNDWPRRAKWRRQLRPLQLRLSGRCDGRNTQCKNDDSQQLPIHRNLHYVLRFLPRA
jgi:hypothetical protein